MRISGIVAATAAGLALGGCSLLPGSPPSDAETQPTNHRVVLEVAGDGVDEADITYSSGDAQEEERGADLPWQETLTTTVLDGISVVAQNTGGAGTLTCTVTVDGQPRKEVAAEGEFALVACDLGGAPAPSPTAG